MRRKYIFGILSFVILAIILLFYLVYQKQEKEKVVINIGVVLPLSGPVAEPGGNCLKGIQLAFEECGFKNKIRLHIEDSKSEPSTGVSSFNKLVSINNVKVVIGDIMSSVTLAIAPIAEKNKVILFSPGASNPKLTNAGDYIFRNIASDDYDGAVMANYLFNELNTKKVVLIFVKNDYGFGVANVFDKVFTTLGGKILLRDSYLQGDNDFRSLVLKIKKTNVEYVYIIGNPKENGYIVKQLYEMGSKIPIAGNLSFENSEFYNIAKGTFGKILFSAPYFNITSEKLKIKNFVNNFTKRYNKLPDVAAALGFDVFNILALALEQNNFLPNNLKNMLYKINNFDGVTGVTTFDSNGDAKKSIYIKEILSDNTINIIRQY